MVDILRQYVWNHLIDPSHHPKSNEYKWFVTKFALDMIKTNTGCCSLAWRDQPIYQVGPFPTSRLHELRAEVVYCQWQSTLLQTLTMTQPPGSHRPLHGLHLTANKVPHTRSCVGIGHSQRECSPLHHGEVPTHAGVCITLTNNYLAFFIYQLIILWTISIN